MQTSLVLEWADGSYDFKLTWAGCAEVERKSNAGIQAIYERVLLAGCHSTDVVEVIRQGLLGGFGGSADGQPVECKPAVVNQLLERYVTGPNADPFTSSWNVARAILSAFMVGYDDSAEKKSATPDSSASQPTAST